MKVVKFDKKYLNEFAKLAVDSFPDWNLKTALVYLSENIEKHGKYCLMVEDDKGVTMGAMFCHAAPYVDGMCLFIDMLLVKEKFRSKGVAKILFHEIIKIAEEDKLSSMTLMADGQKRYPAEWYERLGFKRSGWIEMYKDL